MQRVSKSCCLFLLQSVKAHGNCPGRSDGARPDIGNRTKPAGPTWRRENWNELCSYLGPVTWVAGPFLWWFWLCLACPLPPRCWVVLASFTHSVLLMCHATGTAYLKLNSLLQLDFALNVWAFTLYWWWVLTLACLCAMNLSPFVWTLPLCVGGTKPCHFLCYAIVINPVWVMGFNFGL